jgi:ubiquinone/menaquinone biosynthesis C-methylase UbiE
VKYDLTDLPAGYDRARDHGPAILGLWMDAIEPHVRARRIARILDLGCGTGRFSGGLASRFGTTVLGVDPSARMLRQAQAKSHAGVEYVQAAAEAIPLPTRSVDVVFMSMSYHHFDDTARALRECARVLREQGRAVLRTGTRERIPEYPYVPFFPEARPILDEVLPDLPSIRTAFADAGFDLANAEIVPQTVAPDWSVYAEKLAAGGDSVLSRLAQNEMAAGLEHVRRHAKEAESQAIVEPIDLLVFELRV